jgi:hypothetical protein
MDYVCGRAIKTNISGRVCDPRAYDRDAGSGTFAKIVVALKNKYL